MTPALKMQLVWLALYLALVTAGWWNSKLARAKLAGRTGKLYIAIALFFAPLIITGLLDAMIDAHIDTESLSQQVVYKGPVFVVMTALWFSLIRYFKMIDLMKEAYGKELNP